MFVIENVFNVFHSLLFKFILLPGVLAFTVVDVQILEVVEVPLLALPRGWGRDLGGTVVDLAGVLHHYKLLCLLDHDAVERLVVSGGEEALNEEVLLWCDPGVLLAVTVGGEWGLGVGCYRGLE